MATIFKRQGREVYTANVRLWNAGLGAWEWKQVATGVKDERAARAIAEAMESASGEAKAGNMTKAKAEQLVAMVLQMAGVDWSASMPTFEQFGRDFIEGRAEKLGGSTGRKYLAHWKRLSAWAGPRLKWPLDRWTPALLTDYYKSLRAELSVTTANNHMVTLSMIFLRAVASGHIKGNPAELVDRLENDSEERKVLTRGETAKLLQAIRRKDRPWTLLTLLGWHTGHRIQDLLSLTSASLGKQKGVGRTLAITPAKKEGRGGRVVVLPIPRYVARMFERVKDFRSIYGADNRNGQVSQAFIEWMYKAGVDPLPLQRGKRKIHLKSFHSFRHSMSSRLTAAGVTGELARLVTDHESKEVHRGYVHAEIASLHEALKLARRR